MYYYGPMGGYGWGIIVGLMWLAFLAVVIYAFIRIWHHHESGSRSNTDPLEIVKQRYARGDINKEEYEQLSKDLK